MTIIKQLLTTLAVALLSMLLIGGYGIWQLNQAQLRFHLVQTNTLPSMKAMAMAQAALTDSRVNAAKMMYAPTASDRNDAMTALTAADQRFDATMTDYAANDISDNVDRARLEADKTAMANYRTARDLAINEAKAGNMSQAIDQLLVKARPAAEALTLALKNHDQYNAEQAAQINRENDQGYSQSLMLMFGCIVAAFVISGLLAAHLFSVIRGGLSNIQGTLEQVNHSLDFTQRAPIMRMDEIGRTASAFNSLLERLQHSLKSLHGGAQEVASAAHQLALGASQVSTAAAEQSEAAANMAATVEQMTVSVNHVAEQARQTHQGAAESGKLVEDGSNIIDQTIHDIREISAVVKASALSIKELETDSAKVSSVVNVIKEIADQTNLLALNAAIEAARAGETGRGFAVVADEVRKLAERTSRSTQEIAVTIEAMVARAQQATSQMEAAEHLVETGVGRADHADQAIKRIGGNTTSATRSISEISAAIQQQGVASNNIAAQVERTAQMSEESSSAARLTADSAERLDQLAKSQIETLAQFTI